MSTVCDLVPGDTVVLNGTPAIFITRTQHPLWPQLELVIWRLPDGSWSHDALSVDQFVGQAQPADVFSRKAALQRAVLGGAV